MYKHRLFFFLLLSCLSAFALSAEDKSVDYPAAPDAAVRYVAGELVQMNGGVLWEALPESYRSDIVGFVRSASKQVDAENYERSNKLLGRIASVMDNKREFILNTNIGGSLAEEEKAAIKVALPLLSELLHNVSGGATATYEGLLKFDGKRFFDDTVGSFLRFIDAASKLAGEELSMSSLQDIKVKVLTQEKESALLEIALPGKAPEVENFVLVEERWLPESLVEKWADGMAEARASLDRVTAEEVEANKVQTAMILGILEGVLSQIESAESQESFDLSLKSAAMPLIGLFMMSGQSGIGTPAAPAVPTAPELPSPKADPAK